MRHLHKHLISLSTLVVTLGTTSGVWSSDLIGTFQRLSKSEQTAMLSHIVNGTGKPCTPSGSVYKGKDKKGAAYYTLTCSNGTNWMVTLVNDAEGSTLVTSCEIMKRVGAGCFEMWD